jgi:O-antigen/teichoic acid export membrane protein
VLGGFHLQGLVNFRLALVSGLGGTVSSIIYSLVFVPLCLAYLPLERYGLWALMLQLIRYLDMIDAGVSGASFRLFSAANQTGEPVKVSRIWTASLLLQGLQGAAIFLMGTLLLVPFADFFKLAPEVRDEFLSVFQVIVCLGAARFVLRPFGMLARSHHLHHRLNCLVPVALLGGLLVLSIGLRAGWGIWALTAAFFWEWAWMGLGPVVISWQSGLIPPWRSWRIPETAGFRSLFDFGYKLFLVQSAVLVTQSMPLLIASRMGSLEAGAVWSIGSRVANLIKDILTQIDSAAAPGIFSIASQNKVEELKSRLLDLARLSLIVGSGLAAMYAAWNENFVLLWTSGRVDFPFLASVGLAVFVAMNGAFHSFCLGSQARLAMGPVAKAAVREMILGPFFCAGGWMCAGHVGLAWGQAAAVSLGMLSTSLGWFLSHFAIRPVTFFLKAGVPALLVFAICLGSSLGANDFINAETWIGWGTAVLISLLVSGGILFAAWKAWPLGKTVDGKNLT